MTTSEPFLPVKHVGSDEIDAADPGLGAPGSLPAGDEPDEDARRAFDERMARERENDPLFRTPQPHGDD